MGSIHLTTARSRPPELRAAAGASPVLALGDEASLVEALRAGHSAAPTVLFDGYAEHAQRVLVRILGVDPEIPDLLHEVFLRALQQIRHLREDSKLKAWLTGIAVLTARECIRRRARRRWLRFLPWDQLPELAAPGTAPETSEALQSTYAVLAAMPADERIVFALRYVDQMELTDVAQACGISLATVKRRLAQAQKRFLAIAVRYPALDEWVEGGARWTVR